MSRSEIQDIEAGYRAHVQRIRRFAEHDKLVLANLLSMLCTANPENEDHIDHYLPTCELLEDILPTVIDEEL